MLQNNEYNSNVNSSGKRYLDEFEIRDLLKCENERCVCRAQNDKGQLIGFTHCPAHDDQNPSLRVRTKPYKDEAAYTFHDCFAGCDYSQVRIGIARARSMEANR